MRRASATILAGDTLRGGGSGKTRLQLQLLGDKGAVRAVLQGAVLAAG